MSHPYIAITAGDPCGIGPEIILKTIACAPACLLRRLVVIGDHVVFKKAARSIGSKLPYWKHVAKESEIDELIRGPVFLDCGHSTSFIPSHPTREAGSASLRYLDAAVSLVKGGRAGAIVTAPVTKWAIDLSQRGFTGHTEYFAKKFCVRDVVMMFVSKDLRVVLLTRHMPLSRVSRFVTHDLMRKTICLTHEAMRSYFSISKPRLAICGLNPHAGEGGMFGTEEKKILLPVLRALRRKGIACKGPLSADGLFANPISFDAVICWYHDQGLIPFKMAARDHGCQLSVGLPVIRTSPDHGSALDIAGKGIAEAGSMRYAIMLAAGLSTHAKRGGA